MTAIFKEATPPIPQRSDGRIFDAASLAKAEAEKRLRQLVTKYRSSAPKLAAWLEENLPEGFAVFSQPEAQRRRLRTSNACENLYRQVRRRTAVAGLFPNEASDILTCGESGWPQGGEFHHHGGPGVGRFGGV
jgi:adenylate cyclase